MAEDLVSQFEALRNYDNIAQDAASQEGVDPNIIRAMMTQESGYRPSAVSPKGASGLMQLMPDTAKSLGVTDITDPEQNIRAGTKYFASLLKQYKGDVPTALAAYNAGPGNVASGKAAKFAETQNYVRKVLANAGTQAPQAAPQQAGPTIAAAAALPKSAPPQDDLVSKFESLRQQDAQAPQEEGFLSKVINHPVDSLMNALPVIGGAIGGMVGSVPGAAAGGAAGGGLSTLYNKASELPGALKDVVNNYLNEEGQYAKGLAQGKVTSSPTMEGFLQGAAEGGLGAGKDAAIQGATEGAGKVIGAGVAAGGKALVRNAFNLGRGDVAPQVIEDILATGANPNKAWAGTVDAGTGKFGGGKASALVSASRNKADQMVADAAANGASSADPQEILSALVNNPYGKSVYDTVADQGVRSPAYNRIGNYETQFLLDNPAPMGVERLQALRRAEGSLAEPVFGGTSDSLDNLLHANTEAGARQALEQRIPGFADQNAQTARMMDVMDAVRGAVGRNSELPQIVKRYGLAGIPAAIAGLAGGPLTGAGFLTTEALANPTVESILGRGIAKTGAALPLPLTLGARAVEGTQAVTNGPKISKAKVDSLWEKYQGKQDQP